MAADHHRRAAATYGIIIIIIITIASSKVCHRIMNYFTRTAITTPPTATSQVEFSARSLYAHHVFHIILYYPVITYYVGDEMVPLRLEYVRGRDIYNI